VRALTRRERIGALVANAMDMMDKHWDALLSRNLGGKGHHIWSFGVGNNF